MAEERSKEEEDYIRSVDQYYDILGWGMFIILLSLPLFLLISFIYGKYIIYILVAIIFIFIFGVGIKYDRPKGDLWHYDEKTIKFLKTCNIWVMGALLSDLLMWLLFYVSSGYWDGPVFFEGLIPFAVLFAWFYIWSLYEKKAQGGMRIKYFRSVTKENLENAITSALESVHLEYTKEIESSLLMGEETVYSVDPYVRI